MGPLSFSAGIARLQGVNTTQQARGGEERRGAKPDVALRQDSAESRRLGHDSLRQLGRWQVEELPSSAAKNYCTSQRLFCETGGLLGCPRICCGAH